MTNDNYEADRMEEERQQTVELGSAVTTSHYGTIHTLTIIGQIEGHQVLPPSVKTTRYEHVMPMLSSVEESDEIDGLLLLVNTVGGDIEAGLGIAELVAGMRNQTVSLVLGGGHSIGVPLAVSAKKSFIVPSAGMTIHPVRMTGVVVGAPQTYQYFSRIQERIVEFVVGHSGISRQQFLQYMMATDEIATDIGTVIYGRQAVECGLIDRIGGLGDALECLHRMIGNRRRKKKAE